MNNLPASWYIEIDYGANSEDESYSEECAKVVEYINRACDVDHETDNLVWRYYGVVNRNEPEHDDYESYFEQFEIVKLSVKEAVRLIEQQGGGGVVNNYETF